MITIETWVQIGDASPQRTAIWRVSPPHESHREWLERCPRRAGFERFDETGAAIFIMASRLGGRLWNRVVYRQRQKPKP